MAVFTLHLPNSAPAFGVADDRLITIKDGFSFGAFFFTLPWLLWNRLWLWAGAYVGFMIVASLLVKYAGVNEAFGSASILVGSFFIALDAGALRAEGLLKRGYVQVASVFAAKRDEAELKYLSTVHKTATA